MSILDIAVVLNENQRRLDCIGRLEEQPVSDKNNGDDTIEIPILREQMLADAQETVKKSEELLDGLNSLSDPERSWLEWFYSLSVEDKNVVEICGKRGVLLTPANFEQMKAIVKDHDAKDSGLNE